MYRVQQGLCRCGKDRMNFGRSGKDKLAMTRFLTYTRKLKGGVPLHGSITDSERKVAV